MSTIKGSRPTYLFAFMDDHSRMVTAARWAYAEDAVRLAAALRPALQTHGIPGSAYVDNGAAYVDSALKRTCAKLGIRLIHSKPYRPQGRGKIERFFGSVRSQFLSEITVLTAPVQLVAPGTSAAAGEAEEEQAGTAIGSLSELNALFSSWLHINYHHTVHTSTGQSPLARWEAGWENQTPDRRSAEAIAEAFLWSITRRVSKTATISLQANTYQVDPQLAGAHVELIYDPFDLTGPISVFTSDGAPAGNAVAQEISRHVHPKAAAARADTDTAAKNVSSGIDYLRVVEDRHTTQMTGAPISFDKATTNESTGSDASATETSPTVTSAIEGEAA